MKKLPLAIALASVSAFAQNQDNQSKIEEIIVVSTRTETPAITQGTSFSVIPEQRLEDQAFDSLAEHLTTQVGIDVRQTGGLGSQTGVFIRGEESFRTQLRIDGLKIVDPSGTQAAPIFDSILLSGLNRVEILRGPQGAVYGADAGGVISATSKEYRDGFEASIDGRVGTDNYRRLLGSIGSGGDQGQFSITASTLDEDGFNARVDDASGDEDGYENQTVHAKGELNLGSLWQLGLVLRQHDGEVEFDNCFPASNDCLSESELTAGLISASFNHDVLPQQISVSRTESQRNDFTDGDPSFSLEGEIERVEYLGEYRINNAFKFIYGVDHEEETVEQLERDQTGVHVSFQAGFSERANVNISARYDDNEEFGSFGTYRLSGIFGLASNDQGQLKIKGSIGTGFRAPSLNEQAYNDGDFAFGEAAGLQLQEETSQGFDVALQWFGSNGLFASLGLFDQTVDDQIIFADDFSGYLQNFDESKSQGIEAEFNWPINAGTALFGNYTYNETEDSNGDQRIRRPQHLANIGLRVRPLDNLSIYTNYQIVRDAVAVTTREPLDNYELLNASINLTIAQRYDLYLNLENVLDEEYEQVAGFNTQGRAVYLGGRVNF